MITYINKDLITKKLEYLARVIEAVSLGQDRQNNLQEEIINFAVDRTADSISQLLKVKAYQFVIQTITV